jgi:hypothetical protein
MIHRFKTIDCPDANGRKPQHGEKRWVLRFPLEGGDIIEVVMGKEGRAAILTLLKAEDEKDASYSTLTPDSN